MVHKQPEVAGDNLLRVDEPNTWVLVKAIQELQKEEQADRLQIAQLEGQVRALTRKTRRNR
jgi:hypothetical protein